MFSHKIVISCSALHREHVHRTAHSIFESPQLIPRLPYKCKLPSAVPQHTWPLWDSTGPKRGGVTSHGHFGAPRTPRGTWRPVGPLGPQGFKRAQGTPPELPRPPRGTGTTPESPEHFWKRSLFGLRSFLDVQGPTLTFGRGPTLTFWGLPRRSWAYPDIGGLS